MIRSDQSSDQPRALVLEGASNVRDLGGYVMAGGQRVRFGRVYRAASLSRLTAADVTVLQAADVGVVCDLRGAEERARAPSALPGVTTHALSIEPSLGASLRDLATRRETTGEDVMGLMRRAYTAYALEWSYRYRAMFDLLLVADAPALLFHCSAGKDRTGFGAALLLTALGAGRDVVMEDYMATNRFWRGDSDLAASLPPVVGAVLLRVHPELIEAAFLAIEAAYGSVEAYLADAIGLDANNRARLQTLLLE